MLCVLILGHFWCSIVASVIFRSELREGSKKNSNCKLFPKGGGGQPQCLHLIKSIFGQIDKNFKKILKFTFQRGVGAGQIQLEKFFTFRKKIGIFPIVTLNIIQNISVNPKNIPKTPKI